MRAKFFLNLESVSGSHFVDFLIWNKGLFLSPGVMARSVRSALTGQRGEDPNEGILIIFTESRVWRVLDHLIRMWAPGGAKKTSPLASCSI